MPEFFVLNLGTIYAYIFASSFFETNKKIFKYDRYSLISEFICLITIGKTLLMQC